MSALSIRVPKSLGEGSFTFARTTVIEPVTGGRLDFALRGALDSLRDEGTATPRGALEELLDALGVVT